MRGALRERQHPPVILGHRIPRLVARIMPVDGWMLTAEDERDGDGFFTTAYAAVRGDELIPLDVSRFRFSPTQERFAWLVRNGFPPRPTLGPWDDFDIDSRIAAERSAA